jgi:hypothetical protein
MLAIHSLLKKCFARNHQRRSNAVFIENDGGQTVRPLPRILSCENLIGCYINPSPWDNDVLIFTNHAIYYSVAQDRWSRLLYAEIDSYNSPSQKCGLEGLSINTRRGMVFLRIAGATEQHVSIDAYSLMNFLKKIIRARQLNLLEITPELGLS